jgi:hypothetical protein
MTDRNKRYNDKEVAGYDENQNYSRPARANFRGDSPSMSPPPHHASKRTGERRRSRSRSGENKYKSERRTH